MENNENVKIKGFGDLEEYVENKEEVIAILSKVEFNIEYIKQGGTSYDYKFSIIYNEKTFNFDYGEGFGNAILDNSNKENKIINALWCLLTDYRCVVDYSLVEFMQEFGYDSLKEGEEIYNKILEDNKKLLQVFTEQEIDILGENIQL